MEPIVVFLISALTLIVGLVIGFFISRTQYERIQRKNRETADKIVSERKRAGTRPSKFRPVTMR